MSTSFFDCSKTRPLSDVTDIRYKYIPLGIPDAFQFTLNVPGSFCSLTNDAPAIPFRQKLLLRQRAPQTPTFADDAGFMTNT